MAIWVFTVQVKVDDDNGIVCGNKLGVFVIRGEERQGASFLFFRYVILKYVIFNDVAVLLKITYLPTSRVRVRNKLALEEGLPAWAANWILCVFYSQASTTTTMMLDDGGEDSRLVSSGALLVIFCLQVDDEDAREMVTPQWRFGERLPFLSGDVDDELVRSGAIHNSVDEIYDGSDGGWRRFRSLVAAMEALQICVFGGDDEDANLFELSCHPTPYLSSSRTHGRREPLFRIHIRKSYQHSNSLSSRIHDRREHLSYIHGQKCYQYSNPSYSRIHDQREPPSCISGVLPAPPESRAAPPKRPYYPIRAPCCGGPWWSRWWVMVLSRVVASGVIR
ncbi:hypothetical protein V8G54_013901 [Vigna mungo]|uniref:Uncharacterized protein n=1 Tax=Vigna mungo TaxID=3915 RepID=A0AAQ3NGJ8_VIGMU